MIRRLLDYLTPADRWILVGLLLIALLGLAVNWQWARTPGEWVVVEHNNHVVYKLPLQKNGVYSIPGDVGGLTLRISEGRAWVTESACPNKICMRMGKISHPGQLIVCVPNRLIIRIDGKTTPSFDIVTE